MASNIASVDPTCPICLVSHSVVKMLSTCKHVFCRSCLSAHLKNSIPESATFPCPTCRVENPLPENGVAGLVNYTRDGPAGKELQGAVGGSANEPQEPKDYEIKEDLKLCLSCKYKIAASVRAENLCEDCGQFPMCLDCTEVHSRNKATRNHIVTPLKDLAKEEEIKCKSHDQMMLNFCSTCVRLVCRVCVMLEHGDHEISKIGELFRELVTDVTAITEEKEKQLFDLRQMAIDLNEMKSSALGERDTLLKAIEDHSEQCIEEILNQKNDLKATVNGDYKVIEDVTACLERVAKVVKTLEDSILQAKRMISGNALRQSDLRKLVTTRESLVESGKQVDQINGGVYLKDYKLVQQKKPNFQASAIEFSIGRLLYGLLETQSAAKTNLTGALTCPKKKKKHPGVMCDECNGMVWGVRFKCNICFDYDLCEECKHDGKHSQHLMTAIIKPKYKKRVDEVKENRTELETRKERHPGVMCDECNGMVWGVRFKCKICHDYDLCEDCERDGRHSQHPMIVITKPK